MRKRIPLMSEAYDVARPVAIYVVAIAAVAALMTVVGQQLGILTLGVVIAAIAGTTVYQVRRAVGELCSQSQTAREAAAEAERHYVEVLRRIISFVEARDTHRYGHSENVGTLARRVAAQMGLAEETCDMLALAGQLHDIGLLAVPEACLNSQSEFGVREFRSVQKHSEVSHEVLRPLLMLADVLPGIRAHHERMNGTGYPAGLSGEDIPMEGRILAVADAYDAMTHDRPHRPAITPLQAIRELRRCCPDGYDPACVEALAEVVNMPALEDAATVSEASCRA